MNLNITNNPQLSTCEVQSICEYLATPNGIVEIHDNDLGCNSQLQVEEACESVSIPELKSNLLLSIYPNPFTTSATIEYELKEISDIQFTVYNMVGETVHHEEYSLLPQGTHKITWSPGHLPVGLYYGVLRSGGGVSVVKMV
ncbi:MAG: T9SS type A sorting domain-containing protein, partial [Bacteroidota bacterium]